MLFFSDFDDLIIRQKHQIKIGYCGVSGVSCLVLSSEGSEFGQKTRKKVGQVIACPKEGHSTVGMITK